jgi:AraC-like DNA-binding protein
MRIEDLDRPMVPASYAVMLLDAAAVHGVKADQLLDAAGISAQRLDDPSARVSVIDIAAMLERAMALTGEPGIGYEIGLSSSLMSHGLMGFGMLTSPTFREAIRFGTDYLQLRVPVLSAELRVDDDVAVVSVVETVPLGDLRQVLFDLFLVKVARIGGSVTQYHLGLDDVELWFDYPEPSYYQRFKDRLPTVRFDQGANEVRFDAALLDRRPETADPANAKMVEEQIRREVDELGISDDVVGQVRAALQAAEHGYPSLAEVADQLHLSSRTLKRRLAERATSFHQLVDSARRAEAIRLLTSTSLSIEQVARRLGYSDSSSFRRAFQGWTDTTPGAFRDNRATPEGGSA